jgi:hypothetical protein
MDKIGRRRDKETNFEGDNLITNMSYFFQGNLSKKDENVYM